MSFHAIFKKMVNESSFMKDIAAKASAVNEAYDDNALGWNTRNNILPQVFGGDKHGLRVPDAMKRDEGGKLLAPIPVWKKNGKTQSIYPFVGINGYSNTSAMAAAHGRAASFMRDKLNSIRNNYSVRQILAAQVAAGTGIPANVFLIFPQNPISAVGKNGTKRSASYFYTYNDKDGYSKSIYPYNIQQALSFDTERGMLYPNPEKPGGTILIPIARKGSRSGYTAHDLMYASKLRNDDLGRLACLDDPKVFAEEFTGSGRMDWPNVGGTLRSYMSGANMSNNLGANQDFGNFEKFAAENGFLPEGGSRQDIDYMAIREWILTAGAGEIIEKLIKPYLLKAPFEMIYCWRPISSAQEDCKVTQDDINVYNAITGAGNFEDTAEDIENAEFDITDDGDDVGGELEEGDDVGESIVFYTVDDAGRFINESDEKGSTSVEALTTGSGFWAVCEKFMRGHKPLVSIAPKNRDMPLLRDDNRIKTKDSGLKRTFVRFLVDKPVPGLAELDAKFAQTNVDGRLSSYGGTMNFSPLFKTYSDRVDESMPQTFKFWRLVGYMVSFKYDPDIEAAARKMYGHGRESAMGYLRYYLESPDAVMERGTTGFDVMYVRSSEFGDFLFSSYAQPAGKNVEIAGSDFPPEVSQNNLAADNIDGPHSVLFHDIERIRMPTNYNTNVH